MSAEEIGSADVSSWVKIERCDFSSNEQVLKMIFDKFVELYLIVAGCESLSLPSENLDMNFIDLEQFGDVEKLEDKVSDILKYVNKEEFFLMNKIFFYCMRVSDGDFQFADFQRNLKIIQVMSPCLTTPDDDLGQKHQ